MKAEECEGEVLWQTGRSQSGAQGDHRKRSSKSDHREEEEQEENAARMVTA